MNKKPLNCDRKIRENNRIFNSSLSKKLLNIKRETREENHVRDKTLRLKISQLKKKHGEENWSVKDWSLLSKSRLMIFYNNKEENLSLLGYKEKF